MSEWKECRLGDIISIKSGLPYKGKYLNKGDNYLLGMGCVSFTETFLPNGARRYCDEGKPQYVGKAGDIVLATRQQSDNMPILGMPAIIPDIFSECKVIVGSNLYIVDNKSDVDNRFLFWLLRTPKYINHIRYSQTGSTVRMITKKDIENFTFHCPPKNQRNTISSLLWNIQEKIETNRKINAQLEELAQAIFKSWFIDFEPFGGKMPLTWKNCKLEDIAKISSGKRPSDNGTKFVFHESYPIVGASSIMGYTSNFLYDEPILVIGRVGTHGIVQRWKEKCWPSDNTLVIKSKYYNFAYNVLMRIDYSALNRGSTQPLITQTDIKQIELIFPTLDILDVFENKVTSIFNQIEILSKESARLAALRDTLLPKLMSGELIPE